MGVVVAGVVAGSLALGACGGPGEPDTIGPGGDRAAHGLQVGAGDRVTVALTAAPDVTSVVDATWRAGFVALATGDGSAGTVVSPASLVVALSMLAEGAVGGSAAALDEALGASGDARTDAVNALSAALARYEGDPAAVSAKELPVPPVVHMANQVVADDGVQLNESYLDRLVAGYGAGVLVTDLATAAGKRDLDAWVNRNTGGLIKESAIEPDPALVLVLQNAVALAAAWAEPFEADATSDDAFTLAGGEQVTVPTMHGAATWAYAEVDGWRAVRLPYTADLHADVLLPPAGSSAATDPSSADPDAVAAVVAALDAAEPGQVLLALPKVDLTSRTDLTATFEALGLADLLDPATARLDGILISDQPLFVGQAVQQAVLQVDEDGTRAAAVTELGVAAGSAPMEPPVELVVDRPYLFTVTDGSTGWPLFLASVLDPRG